MKSLMVCLCAAVLMLGLFPHGADAKAGAEFYKKINQIDQLIQKKKWSEAQTETRALRKLYKKKEWKIQLIGDEREYEGIGEGLDALHSAVKVKDKVQASMELANIHALLESAYSF